jgi:hypothetical protein
MTTVRVLYSAVHTKWMPLKRHHGLLVIVFNLFLVPLIPLPILSYLYLRCLNDPASPLPSYCVVRPCTDICTALFFCYNILLTNNNT